MWFFSSHCFLSPAAKSSIVVDFSTLVGTLYQKTIYFLFSFWSPQDQLTSPNHPISFLSLRSIRFKLLSPLLPQQVRTWHMTEEAVANICESLSKLGKSFHHILAESYYLQSFRQCRRSLTKTAPTSTKTIFTLLPKRSCGTMTTTFRLARLQVCPSILK